MPVYLYVGTAAFAEMIAAERYIPRGRNELHSIFDRHFADFCEHYDEKYAVTYGMYRLERIQQIGERVRLAGALRIAGPVFGG